MDTWSFSNGDTSRMILDGWTGDEVAAVALAQGYADTLGITVEFWRTTDTETRCVSFARWSK